MGQSGSNSVNSLYLLCPPFLSQGTALCPSLIWKNATPMSILVIQLCRYSGEDLPHKLFSVFRADSGKYPPDLLVETLKKGNVKALIFWTPFLAVSWVCFAGASFVRAGTHAAVPAPWESHGKVGALLCIAKKDLPGIISQIIKGSWSEEDLAHSQFALLSHCDRPTSIKSTVL